MIPFLINKKSLCFCKVIFETVKNLTIILPVRVAFRLYWVFAK
jgi:hypothetical protein